MHDDWLISNQFPFNDTVFIVVGTIESKHQVEDEGQQQQPNTKHRRFPEDLCHPHAVNDADKQNSQRPDEWHKTEEIEQNPPFGSAQDLGIHVNVVKRDEYSPSGLAGFGENLPAGDKNNTEQEQEDREIGSGQGGPCGCVEH